jgi:phytoene dehydrogenase-like protein
VPAPEPDRETADCVIVGGGLAGLACAEALVRAGRSVRLVEAEDAVGGRARTVWREGRPVDRGFQALFSAYRETRRLVRSIGIPRRDLRPFGRRVIVHDGERWRRYSLAPRAALGERPLAAADAGRLARLAAEVATRPPEVLLAEPPAAETTEAYLRGLGFSDDALEHLFRPLFGAILLDRSLSADPGWFRFLLAMLARGRAVLPSDGLGMIAEWAAATVRQAGGEIRLGAPVAALDADGSGRRLRGVRLAGGGAVAGRQVVLAVDPPAARALLGPLDGASTARLPERGASVLTAAFLLRHPLYRGRSPLLNAAPHEGPGPRVDLLCQTTNVTRPRAPGGPDVLLAACVTTDDPAEPSALPAAVGDLVGRWSPGYPWASAAELIDVWEHRFAQFRPLAGVRAELPGPRTAVDNLVLAGDLTLHPSIEGAVASGARAARIVDALLP